MHENDLMEGILSVIPNATFGEDSDGQIVIYTNLHYIDENHLEDMGDY